MDPIEDKLAAADKGETLAQSGAQAGALAPIDPAVQAAAEAAQQWIDAVKLWGPVLRESMPEYVRPHWTDERIEAVGVRLAAVGKHYGWSPSDAVGHPVAGLIAALFPLLWPLAKPILLPMIKEQFGRKEKPVDQTATTQTFESPLADPAPKPPKVDPIG